MAPRHHRASFFSSLKDWISGPGPIPRWARWLFDPRRQAGRAVVVAAALSAQTTWAETTPPAATPPARPAKRVLRMGVYTDSFPYSFTDAHGHLAGFSVELTEALARAMDLSIKVEVLEANELSERFQKGDFDCLQMLRETEERMAWADFSIPYVYAQHAVFLRRDGPPIHQLSDLQHRRVVVNRTNATALLFVHTLQPAPEILYADSAPAALQMLERGQADAAMLGKLLAQSFIEQLGLTNITLYSGPTPHVEQRLGYAVHKGDKELLGRINEGLAKLYHTGEFDRIYAKWFGRFEPQSISREAVIVVVAGVLALGVIVATWFGLRQRRLVRRIADQQATLQNSERIFRNLFNNTAVGMFRSKADGSALLSVNDKLLELMGWTRAEAAHTPSILHWEEPRQREALMLRLRTEQRVLDFEGRFLTRQGEVRICLVSLNLYPAEEILEGSLIDLTELKRAEAERQKLEVQNRQLQKSESLGRMAGAIAHVFNNRLQAVMLGMELAMDAAAQNPEIGAALAEAMRSARNAAEVSNRMLTYLGQSHGSSEWLDLSEVCAQSLYLLRALIPRDMILETDLPAPGPGVSANTNQLHQVLTNLVTNAAEASVAGQGTIRLSVKTVAAAQIPAAGRFPVDWQPQAAAYACVEVADAGCGIAAQDLEKICDPFFSDKFTGRGLGLSIVLGIVRERGGLLTVESEVSRGSIFRVFLPVSSEAKPRKPDPVKKNTGRATECTVLVVEDEWAVRKTVSAVLERSGFSVLAAEDGAEALRIFQPQADRISCVLCDVSMPGMSGWDTLTALRRLAPKVPVILASGYSESQVMQGTHADQPDFFLHKPYEIKALIEAINRVLPDRPA